MRNLEQLGAEARALFHKSTGYCATPGARARAAYLERQEEEAAARAARSLRKPFNHRHQFSREQAK